MESFGRFIEILVTIVLIFLVPIQYFAIKQDMISQSYITAETSYFVDSARNLGYISKEMYETYLRKIDTTNNVYDIKMTHYRYVLEANGDGYSKHYYCTYEDEILDGIYADDTKERYEFHQGDYLVLKVKNKNKTFGTLITEHVMGIFIPTEQIQVVYGGAIRDEAD